MYKRNIEARSRNHCCRGKAVNITYSERVSVALVIQHAKRMRHPWFQVSAAMFMRSALFWYITQRRVVILYRRFGTMYWPHLQGSSSLLGFLDPSRWDRYVIPKRRYNDYHSTLRNMPEERRSHTPYYVVICDLSGSTIFFHIIS
jgi:hypothetical protein